jgi:hypothetical protein
MKAFTDRAVPFSISSAVGLTTFLGHFGERLSLVRCLFAWLSTLRSGQFVLLWPVALQLEHTMATIRGATLIFALDCT